MGRELTLPDARRRSPCAIRYNEYLVRRADRHLEPLLASAPGPERTAGLAAWFQSLYQEGEAPVLVGGGALELYTGGAYTTDDLDFVGELPEPVLQRLTAAGFSKQGRHGVHERGEVFLELPGRQLEAHERTTHVQAGRWKVLALSPEDVLVDRLAAWQFWGSRVDALNALLLWQSMGERLDVKRLRTAAGARGVETSLQRLRRFVREHGAQPTSEKLERWLRPKA